MKLRLSHILLGAIASLVLVTGCHSSRQVFTASRAAEPDSEVDRRAKAHAYYSQAVVLDMQKRNDEGLEAYHKAAELDPSNEELVVQVARRWLLLKKPDRAIELLKVAAAQSDSTAMMDVLLGTAYANSGKTNLSIASNLKATRKAPQLLAAHQNLHLNYAQAGRTNDAMQVLDQAAKIRTVDSGFLVGLAELYVNYTANIPSLKSNANSKALVLLNRAEPMSITNVQSRVRLADGFNVLGQSEKAEALYQSLLAEFPDAPLLQENIRAKLTDIYLRGKDRKKAIEQLEVIVTGDPGNLQAHYYLAMLSAEAGDAEKAAKHYGHVVVLNPKFEQAYYDLASSQLAAKKTNDVFKTLRTAQTRFGQNFVSEFLYGMAHSHAGQFADAVKRYNSAENIARTNDVKRLTPLFYFQMGMALERKGDYSEAVSCFEKVLDKNPEFHEAANYLGYMWAERGENLERAKELIERAVKAEPKSNAYLDSLAWVLFKLGKVQEALPVMLQAIEIAQAEKELDAALYDHLGDIQMALGNREKANEAWRKALLLGPNEVIRKKIEASPAP